MRARGRRGVGSTNRPWVCIRPASRLGRYRTRGVGARREREPRAHGRPVLRVALDLAPAAGELGALDHRGQADVTGLGDHDHARVEPGPIVGHDQPNAAVLLPDRDLDPVGSRVLARVGDRLLRDPEQDRLRLARGLARQPVLDRRRGLRVAGPRVQRGREPLAVERRRTQLEQQVTEPLDRRGDHLAKLPGLRRQLCILDPFREGLRPQVRRAHHLDRVVVDVGGDASPLLFLRLLEPQQEPTTLLHRPAERVHAATHPLLGPLGLRDVDHEAAPEHRVAVVVADQDRLVAEPDDAVVRRPESVLGAERLATAERRVVFGQHALAIVLVHMVDPQVGVRAPALHGEPEQRLDLRAGVDVGRTLVVGVDVQHRRDALDQVPVRLVRLAQRVRERGGHRDLAHSLYPIARRSALRSASSPSVSTPSGGWPSITPSTPRPPSVSPTTISSGFAVAQKIRQTSGTVLIAFNTLTGNPPSSATTNTWPAAIACALRTATSTSARSLPLRRTSRGPLASLNAIPKRRPGTLTHASCRSSTVLMKWDWPTITLRSSGLSKRTVVISTASTLPGSVRVEPGEYTGEQRDSRNHAGQIQPLAGAVIVPADRAEPVQGRDARARGRVRVRGAAGRRVPQLEPELGGDLDRERGQPGAALLLLHGPMPAVAEHLDRHVR